MKKIVSLLLFALSIVSMLSGCGQAAETADSEGKLKVVTTIFPPYDFSREIAGDKAEITMLLPPGSESHMFEPSPQDIKEINNCDVFIYVGGESDVWVERILSSIDTDKIKVITLMDCVEAVEEEVVEGMQEEEPGEAEDSDEIEYDEHVWTSPKNAKLIVQKVSDTFCEVDPENAAFYKSNTADYLSELSELDAKFQEVADNGVRNTIVFGDRFPFRYFADAYGLKYYAALPGCSPDTEASASTVKFLIDKIRDENIPVVFHIELSNEKMAKTISDATGARVMLLHACHNISQEDFNSGVTYLDLMTKNLDALREALN